MVKAENCGLVHSYLKINTVQDARASARAGFPSDKRIMGKVERKRKARHHGSGFDPGGGLAAPPPVGFYPLCRMIRQIFSFKALPFKAYTWVYILQESRVGGE